MDGWQSWCDSCNWQNGSVSDYGGGLFSAAMTATAKKLVSPGTWRDNSLAKRQNLVQINVLP
jgi:hypothetical protein